MSAIYLQPSEFHGEVATGTRLTPEQQAVVASNMGLISKVVRRGAANYEDAYQNGVLGLARAAQKFDPSKGFQFSTYAIWWIRAAVQKGGELDSVHGPRNARRGDPLPHLVALDAPLGDEDASSFADMLPADDDPEADALSLARTAEIAAVLHRVCKDDVDRGVVEALLARSPPTKAALGQRFGMSQRAIQQRQARLVARARHPVYRKTRPMNVEAATPTQNGYMPHVPVEAPTTGGFVCPECGRDFSRAQALGRHRNSHGVKGKTAKAPDRNPGTRPRLDSTTIKASLYDEDDYDPWLVLVGTADDEGPRIETAVVSTKVDAEQVAALLAALGHQPRRFRLADGA